MDRRACQRHAVRRAMTMAPFKGLRRAAIMFMVAIPAAMALMWLLARGPVDLRGLLALTGGAALWGIGTLAPMLVKPEPRGVRMGEVSIVRYAPWRRRMSALLPWPVLALSMAASGDAWKHAVPPSAGLVAILWSALGQQVHVDGHGIRMAGGLGRGSAIAWDDITTVSVHLPRVLVRGRQGPWLGANVLAMDSGAELISQVLARCPHLVAGHRADLEAVVAWANGQDPRPRP